MHISAWKQQRGLTLPMVAIFMFAFCLLAAFAVDLGIAYSARTSAQHSADAAALAGAYTWVNAATLTGTDRVIAATKDAAAVANVYKVFDRQVNVSTEPQDPTACATESNIVCVDEAKKRVTVTVALPVNTYFGKIIPNLTLLQVRVVAIAEAAENAVGDRCLKPFYLSNDAIAPPGLSCAEASALKETILDANSNEHELTKYAQDYINAQTSFSKTNSAYWDDPGSCETAWQKGEVGPGCPFGFWTQHSTQPSQWGVVDFSEGQGNGESLVACAVSKCLQECLTPIGAPLYKCGDPVAEIKTGQSTGQIDKQLHNIIGQVGDNPVNFYLDAPYSETPSFLNSGVTQSTSPSLMSVLVWDCRAPLPNGTQPKVTVLGTALIFVNKIKKSSDSSIFLINGGSCGSGSLTPGPATLPVRLVNI